MFHWALKITLPRLLQLNKNCRFFLPGCSYLNRGGSDLTGSGLFTVFDVGSDLTDLSGWGAGLSTLGGWG